MDKDTLIDYHQFLDRLKNEILFYSSNQYCEYIENLLFVKCKHLVWQNETIDSKNKTKMFNDKWWFITPVFRSWILGQRLKKKIHCKRWTFNIKEGSILRNLIYQTTSKIESTASYRIFLNYILGNVLFKSVLS